LWKAERFGFGFAAGVWLFGAFVLGVVLAAIAIMHR